jgi:predicted RNA-binding Zn ribbon-like protein
VLVDTSAPLLGEPVPVELVNTVWADRDGVHDALESPAEAAAWLAAIAQRSDLATGVDVSAMSAADLERLTVRLRRLRDALRRLAAQATDDPRPNGRSPITGLEAAVIEVNRAAAETPRWSTLNWSPGADPSRMWRAGKAAPYALLSEIAESAVELFAGVQRPRLRACLAPGCVLYFIKGHPRREWCSAGCGNRARVARHYRRHHAVSEGTQQG